MSRYSNQMNIPLPLAVFLATDDYDYDPTAISATALTIQRINSANIDTTQCNLTYNYTL